jgi:hypothetical protein
MISLSLFALIFGTLLLGSIEEMVKKYRWVAGFGVDWSYNFKEGFNFPCGEPWPSVRFRLRRKEQGSSGTIDHASDSSSCADGEDEIIAREAHAPGDDREDDIERDAGSYPTSKDTRRLERTVVKNSTQARANAWRDGRPPQAVRFEEKASKLRKNRTALTKQRGVGLTGSNYMSAVLVSKIGYRCLSGTLVLQEEKLKSIREAARESTVGMLGLPTSMSVTRYPGQLESSRCSALPEILRVKSPCNLLHQGNILWAVRSQWILICSCIVYIHEISVSMVVNGESLELGSHCPQLRVCKSDCLVVLVVADSNAQNNKCGIATNAIETDDITSVALTAVVVVFWKRLYDHARRIVVRANLLGQQGDEIGI